MIKKPSIYPLLILAFFISYTLTSLNKNSIATKSLLQQIIKGVVVDSEGISLPGITILNKNTGKGTTTDFDGNFSIEASLGDELVFTYIGFEQKSIIISNIEEELSIILNERAALNEVVVLSISESESERSQKQLIPCWNAPRLISPSIYDSRFESYELDSSTIWQQKIKKQIESVAMIVEKEKLYMVSENEYELDISNSLKEIYNLCDNQNFQEQPVVGNGTGFIISEDTMVTANHVFERDVDSYVVVFGFEVINESGKIHSRIKDSDIFYPKQVINRFEDLDVVTFNVDRPFKRPKLDWETSSKLKESNEIYMIGNPSGLPTKISLNADIIDNSTLEFFYTSLDSFQGNSGSPIFNLCTNKVIGILVSGEIDYEYNGDCYRTTLCTFPYCKGEKVIRVENIMRN
ncbi:S1 family peptidase [Tenacibaculum jejuense]|uniref:Serine protease n=1 Tax=Tenacibaculum jejuense TaxID=584609 RepID=A0A238UDI2_9FLAO|nr:serine protease [Tenacibaculum jejuense]SNR16638.1 Probable peptidase [Tenacibaculum jejuense]